MLLLNNMTYAAFASDCTPLRPKSGFAKDIIPLTVERL
jgi:hypothetical protein